MAKGGFEIWVKTEEGWKLAGREADLAKADNYVRGLKGEEDVLGARIVDTAGEVAPREYSLGNS